MGSRLTLCTERYIRDYKYPLIIYGFGNLRVHGIFEIKFKKISNKIAKLGNTRRWLVYFWSSLFVHFKNFRKFKPAKYSPSCWIFLIFEYSRILVRLWSQLLVRYSVLFKKHLIDTYITVNTSRLHKVFSNHCLESRFIIKILDSS